MEGRPRTNPEQDRVLAQGRSSGECQRLKSDIYLSLSVWHSTSITNFPQEDLLSEAFSLTILSFTVLILLNFTSSLSSTLSVWCGRNLRVHLSIGCPRYSIGKFPTVFDSWEGVEQCLKRTLRSQTGHWRNVALYSALMRPYKNLAYEPSQLQKTQQCHRRSTYQDVSYSIQQMGRCRMVSQNGTKVAHRTPAESGFKISTQQSLKKPSIRPTPFRRLSSAMENHCIGMFFTALNS